MIRFFLACAALLCSLFQVNAQIDIENRIKNKVNQRVENKIDRSIDKTLDKTEEEAEKAAKGEGKKDKNESTKSEENSPGSKESTSSPDAKATSPEKTSLKTYGKFDFIPGDKIVLYEDFTGIVQGDFPADWNTNTSAEIVKADGREGNWLMMPKEGVFLPEYITDLPENFTFQFDLLCNEDFNYYSSGFIMSFSPSPERASLSQFGRFGHTSHMVRVVMHPNGNGGSGSVDFTNYDGERKEINSSSLSTQQFNVPANTYAKVSVWRQKQRLRMYINEEKVLDIPRAFDATQKYNTVSFANGGFGSTEDRYLITNLRLAAGAPDTRSKLITEGKLVTRGILFDSGSDKIKPESYGTLKDIANVLTENGDVRVRIIGHTDSDGDDKVNLDLSKRRADAVKEALTKEFGVNTSRMDADGKGEAEPSDRNDNASGKANNRRVEFVKL